MDQTQDTDLLFTMTPASITHELPPSTEMADNGIEAEEFDPIFFDPLTGTTIINPVLDDLNEEETDPVVGIP